MFKVYSYCDHTSPGDKTVQCGRSVDIVKLWMQWRGLGDTGMEANIDLSFRNAQSVTLLSQQVKLLNCGLHTNLIQFHKLLLPGHFNTPELLLRPALYFKHVQKPSKMQKTRATQMGRKLYQIQTNYKIIVWNSFCYKSVWI